MTSETTFVRLARLSWPVLGGVWGGWLGFGGYLRLPQNADSFAMVFAIGYFILFACVGLVVGGASGALVGGLVEKLLRQLGVPIAGALCVATLVNVLALWQIADVVQTQFPGLKSEGGHSELAALSWTLQKWDNRPREVSDSETTTFHERI